MAQLKVLTSDSQDFTGRTLPLEGEEITIGRSQESTILVPDAAVSRRHAKIVRTPEGLLLVDDGGRNGLFVNGERTTHRVLLLGDVIRVGHTELAFEPGPGEAAPLLSHARTASEQGPRQVRSDRLEQTTMLEAALLAPPVPAAGPAGPVPPRLQMPRPPAAGAPLPSGGGGGYQAFGGPAPAGPRWARAPQRAMTPARALLALGLLLAGILMVTGVLLARDRGLLGRRAQATSLGQEVGPGSLEGATR